MAHLITSVITAAIVALAVYIETASFGLAFLAYSGAGMLVLFTVLAAAALASANEEQMSAAQG